MFAQGPGWEFRIHLNRRSFISFVGRRKILRTIHSLLLSCLPLHSLTQSLIDSLTHSFTRSFIHSFTYSIHFFELER